MKRPEKRQKNSVSFKISKKDKDIANWLNDLRTQKIPLAKVVSAVLVAYDQGEVTCIGSPSQKNKTSQNTHNTIFEDGAVMFGIGDAKDCLERRSRDGWGKRGYNNEYVVGSVPVFTVRNLYASAAIEKLKQNGDNISSVLKYAIRECWKAFPDAALPDMDALDRLLSPPRKTLRKPSNAVDIDDNQKLPHKQVKTAKEKPVQEHKPEEPVTSKWRNPLLDLI